MPSSAICYALRAVGVQKHFVPFWHGLVPRRLRSRPNPSKQALCSVDIEVPLGRIHGLVGPNASGKSTLMRIVSGSLLPDAGELWLFGEKHRPGSFATRRLVVRVSVGSLVSCELSALENLKFLLCASGERLENGTEALRWLEELGVSHNLQQQPLKRLSSGKQQVVNLVCALSLGRDLVMLDEPFVYLDACSCDYLLRLIRKRSTERGTSFLIASHDLELLQALCDSFTVLCFGKTIASGSMSVISEAAGTPGANSLASAFLRLVDRVESKEAVTERNQGIPSEVVYVH